MPRHTFAIFASLAFAAAIPASALSQPEGPNLFSGTLTISTPRGQFDENTDTGFGFTGSYLRSITPNRVVGVGLSGSFLGYGSTRRRAPLSNTIPDITVDVETSNNTAFVLGMLEVRVPGRIQPYVQAVA